MLDFNLKIERNDNFVKAASEQLSKLEYQIVIHDLSRLISQFQSFLEVKNPDYTNVLVISLNDIIPQRATLILDTLSKVYINKSLNSRFEINERTVSYIDKQLDEVSASLKEIEDTMQNYKKQNAILDLDWERQDFFKKLADYDAQKSTITLNKL